MRQRQRQRLSVFIERTHHGKAAKRTLLELGPSDPQRHFTPQRHNLTPEQCRIANALLSKAERERPLSRAPQQVQFRRALRCAGILSAVKRGVVGQTRFGHHLMGYRGGRVLAMHALDHLRAWSPIASLAALMAKERRAAQAYYEEHGEVLPIGTAPAPSPEAQRIQDMTTLWEESEWQRQRDRLQW